MDGKRLREERTNSPEMVVYRHTQPGTLIIVAVSFPLLVMVGVSASVGVHPASLVILFALIAVMVLFHSLTVEVGERRVRLRFGPGPIGRSFPTESIVQALAVRNRWYYGWGIRYFFRGWLYNVSGLDAVEIVMRDGRVYRIGTDEPGELLRAIDSVRPPTGAASE